MRLAARVTVAVALAATVAGGWGCAERLRDLAGVTNQPPVVSLTSTAVGSAGETVAEHHLSWIASDPDGRVDHYLVTTDIGALRHETEGWVATTERQQSVQVRRAVRGAARPTGSAEPEFDFFAVRAVDERGAVSKPAYRAFFGENVAPTVRIVSPTPSQLPAATVPPTFRIRWEGSDPDGPNGRPAQYKYRLFHGAEISFFLPRLLNPDSLVRPYAPAFAGWDSVSGDSTGVQLTNLQRYDEYLFAITALGAEGAYDPVFSLDRNLLRMFVADPGTLGPLLTMFNSFFSYTYPRGGILPDSMEVVRVQAPASEPFTVNWIAWSGIGFKVTGYRWALDIADVSDETPRTNKNDLAHWSAWNLATTSATVGPFHGAALDVPHRLYVEAQDASGVVSLGIVEFRLVRPTFDKDLLIVDDTRRGPDMKSRVLNPNSPDSLAAPTGPWPTAAELDTFLYAVGGVRWRMTPNGSLSPQGIFKGYRFDTLGTRRSLLDPTIPLDVLGRYRHIIWMTDAMGALNYAEYNGGSPTNPIFQMTTLFYMCMPNRTNTLAVWVQSGGKLWALGGGIGSATNIPWNSPQNDTQGRVYSSSGPRPDLTPGRFMYDLAHWRSEFRPLSGLAKIRISVAPFPIGGWPGAPSYGLLPAKMRDKGALDPQWPLREPFEWYGNPWYPVGTAYGIEFLSKPNSILEDKNPSPRHEGEIQSLDTLMVAIAPAILPAQGPNPAVDRIVNPVMTYYHGRDCGPVVFSGFDIWTWTGPDCVRLVDAVLTGIWGLPRSTDASGPAAGGRR